MSKYMKRIHLNSAYNSISFTVALHGVPYDTAILQGESRVAVTKRNGKVFLCYPKTTIDRDELFDTLVTQGIIEDSAKESLIFGRMPDEETLVKELEDKIARGFNFSFTVVITGDVVGVVTVRQGKLVNIIDIDWNNHARTDGFIAFCEDEGFLAKTVEKDVPPYVLNLGKTEAKEKEKETSMNEQDKTVKTRVVSAFEQAKYRAGAQVLTDKALQLVAKHLDIPADSQVARSLAGLLAGTATHVASQRLPRKARGVADKFSDEFYTAAVSDMMVVGFQFLEPLVTEAAATVKQFALADDEGAEAKESL